MSKVAWPPQPSNPSIDGTVWHYRGAYALAQAYVLGDLVTSGTIMYLATAGIPAGARPGTDARWVLITVGAQGERGQQGVPGADGANGAPGAQGDKGATGPVGTPGGLGPFTWNDIDLSSNGWTADPTNPPQIAIDATDTVWLRGEATPPTDSDDTTITSLPTWARPPYKHDYDAFYQRVQIFGDHFGTSGGLVMADDIDHAVHLATSFRVTPADPHIVGTRGVPYTPFAGELEWERSGATTMRITGSGVKVAGPDMWYLFKYQSDAPLPIDPTLAALLLPYRFGADLLTLNGDHTVEHDGTVSRYYGTPGEGTATITLDPGTGPVTYHTTDLRLWVDPFWAPGETPPDADARQVYDSAQLSWGDFPFEGRDLPFAGGSLDLSLQWTLEEIDVTFDLPFMDF